jgi:urease accessory protein
MTASSAGHLDGVLGILQLTDSSFPSGLYTLSHGLEAYAQAGLVAAATLEPLVAALMRFGVGPADGVALAHAHRTASDGRLDPAVEADLRLSAVKLAREAREASIRTGRQCLSLASEVFGGAALPAYLELVRRGEAPGNHAVVLGLATATLGVPRDEAVAGELYAFAAGCVGAAVRLALIDHRLAQRILHRLRPVIVEIVAENRDKEIEEIGGCLPLAEIMGMRHERAELRLFAS